jgi:hypothetical protein
MINLKPRFGFWHEERKGRLDVKSECFSLFETSKLRIEMLRTYSHRRTFKIRQKNELINVNFKILYKHFPLKYSFMNC